MSLLLKSAPFLVAFGMVAFTLGNAPFPDLAYGPVPANVQTRAVNTLPVIPPIALSITELALATPAGPVVSEIESSGCLDNLTNLPQAMAESCSRMVADAVLQIANFEGDPSFRTTTRQTQLVERLRLAAANVCRARWAASDSWDFNADDPVCAVSTMNLASLN